MGVNKVVYDSKVLLDLTEDTVTPEDLVKGIVAHDKSGQQITGTIPLAGSINCHYGTVTPGTYDGDKCAYIETSAENTKIIDSYLNEVDQAIVKKAGVKSMSMVKAENFGDAETSDVAKDKIFTSAAGAKVKGTCQTLTDITDEDAIVSSSEDDRTLSLTSVTPTLSVNGNIVDKGMSVNGTTSATLSTGLSNFGDASVYEVAEGKTFTSTDGVAMSGKLKRINSIFGYASSGKTDTYTIDGVQIQCLLAIGNGSITPVSDDEIVNNGMIDRDNTKSIVSHLYYPLSNLGNATAADVASGKTFTSSAGLKVTGTKTETTYDTANQVQGDWCEPSTASRDLDGVSTKTIELESRNVTMYNDGETADGKRLIDPNNAKVVAYAKLSDLGEVKKDNVASGETFTSSAGLKVTGTMTEAKKFQCVAFNLSEETSDGGIKYINFTPLRGYPHFSPDADSNVELGKCYITKAANLTYNLQERADNFGNATAADVASGKTFTSSAGLKVTGTNTSTGGSFTTQTKTVTPKSTTQTVTPDSGYNGLSKVTVNGDSNLVAANIKSGVSIFGVSGSYTGSSSNDIEACLVDVTNPTVSFTKTTGEIKVYGYAYTTSSQTWGGTSTTQYAFDGDGYYRAQYYGTQSKTSCTFGVSNGKLTGLPTLNGGTLLAVMGM